MDNKTELNPLLKHNERLDFFLNATDDELSTKLELIEELNGTEGFSVLNYTESPFCGFHPKCVRMVLRNDDYYLKIRANHFVLIFGCSEALNDWDECVVCLANHKGGLLINIYRFLDSMSAKNL
jgi:hypothetical protein